MRPRLSIAFFVILAHLVMAQTRNNFIYTSFLKFPESYYNVTLGVDHAIKLTRKDWSSERLYLVFSPNLMWSGYKFNNLDEQNYLTSRFEKYEVTLPMHLRFEFAPYRINLNPDKKKIGNDLSVFFDVGVSANYLLGAHLREQYSYSGSSGDFNFLFNESLTSTISNRTTLSYLHFNFGFRIHRFLFFLRFYGSFRETSYKNLTSGWSLPQGTHSFFYQEYLISDYLKQNRQYNLLCIGYTF